MLATNNARVYRFAARAVAGLVVGPFLALAGALAPVHAHEREADHSHVLIHSHVQTHEAVHDHDGTEVEPGSEHIVWLDSAIIHAVPYQLDPPAALVSDSLELVESPASWSSITFNASAPVHGPPRRGSSLRGPPSLPA